MSETPSYTEYHPRWYRARISTYWWLWQRSYLKFILRELSSVFVALWVVVTLAQIGALARGPESYSKLQSWLRTPLSLALATVTFLFVVFHAITWFNAAPQAMAVRVRGRRVPNVVVAGIHYAAWLALSALVAWSVLGG
jgi:fumarate reductase subunit C